MLDIVLISALSFDLAAIFLPCTEDAKEWLHKVGRGLVAAFAILYFLGKVV